MQLLQGDSELGRYLRENNIVRPKAFMPDSVVEQIFAEFLKSLDAGDFLVIEGFPINHVQFHGMKRQLDRAGRQLDRVIVLDDEPDSILARIALRRVCPACELKMGRVSLFLRLLYAVHIAVDRWLAVQRMTRLFWAAL